MITAPRVLGIGTRIRVNLLEFKVARSYYGVVNRFEIDVKGKVKGEKRERGKWTHGMVKGV